MSIILRSVMVIFLASLLSACASMHSDSAGDGEGARGVTPMKYQGSWNDDAILAAENEAPSVRVKSVEKASNVQMETTKGSSMEGSKDGGSMKVRGSDHGGSKGGSGVRMLTHEDYHRIGVKETADHHNH